VGGDKLVVALLLPAAGYDSLRPLLSLKLLLLLDDLLQGNNTN